MTKAKTKRPWEHIPTQKLKFMIGVSKAGLTMWNKRDPKYREVEMHLFNMEAELLLRFPEPHPDKAIWEERAEGRKRGAYR